MESTDHLESFWTSGFWSNSILIEWRIIDCWPNLIWCYDIVNLSLNITLDHNVTRSEQSSCSPLVLYIWFCRVILCRSAWKKSKCRTHWIEEKRRERSIFELKKCIFIVEDNPHHILNAVWRSIEKITTDHLESFCTSRFCSNSIVIECHSSNVAQSLSIPAGPFDCCVWWCFLKKSWSHAQTKLHQYSATFHYVIC